WAMLLHLSLLAGHVIPLAGFTVPVLIWQSKREEFPDLEQHAWNAANWIISEIIYLIMGIVLAQFIFKFLVVVPFSIVAVAFPVIGALKAAKGEVWRYPLTFDFIK
ncbi:MAG: DUF4870 domain-containing protein, partial [Planctomycetaceae bacterium]|nr:DUF4870 domain-containing protein [Planctomycetaceae bacterium]